MVPTSDKLSEEALRRVGDEMNGGNLPSRAREWFGKLGRAQKVLAASATLVITVGGVASGITAVLDLGGRISAASPAPSDAPATALPVAEGVRVTEVIPGSPADRAGLEVGDIITDVGGKSVEDVDDLRKALGEVSDGESVLVSVVRGSDRKSVSVKPGPIEGTRQRVGVGTQDIAPETGGFGPGPEEESEEDNTTRAQAVPSEGTASAPATCPPEADSSAGRQYCPED